MDHRVAADPDVHVDVRGLRVLQGHAVREVARVDPFAEDPRRPGEVRARVDAHRSAGVDPNDRDALTLLDQDREDLVQVVLTLRVLAPHERQRPEQVVASEDDPIGADLADRPHRGGRVAPLDDRDEAVAVAHDARVAAGTLDLGRDHRGGGLRPPVGPDQRADVLGGDRVEVAIGDQHLGCPPGRPLGREDGVAGAERLALLHEHGLGNDPPRPSGLADLLGAVMHDDHDLRRARGPDVLQHPPQGGSAAHRVQHLGHGRLQALALACGEHDRNERVRSGARGSSRWRTPFVPAPRSAWQDGRSAGRLPRVARPRRGGRGTVPERSRGALGDLTDDDSRPHRGGAARRRACRAPRARRAARHQPHAIAAVVRERSMRRERRPRRGRAPPRDDPAGRPTALARTDPRPPRRCWSAARASDRRAPIRSRGVRVARPLPQEDLGSARPPDVRKAPSSERASSRSSSASPR